MSFSPNFIIGLPRSGTTALANVLSQNPFVSVASPKEPNIINSHKGTMVRDTSEPNLRVYKSFFENIPNKIDASAHMFHCPLAPTRISELFPDSRFCIIIRNPIDRIESHWKMVNSVERVGKEWADFSTAWNDEYFRDSTRYLKPYQLWRTHFEAKRFLIINFEDLTTDICSVAGEVAAHFGIEDEFEYSTPDSSELNHSKFKKNFWWKITMSIANKITPKLRASLSRYIPNSVKRLILLDFSPFKQANNPQINTAWKNIIIKDIQEDYEKFKLIAESEFPIILPKLRENMSVIYD